MEDVAIEAYREALKVDSNFAPANRQIGFILSQRQDRMSEAVDAYMQALRTDTDPAGLYTRIALIYIHLNRIPEAIQSLEQEIRSGSADADTYYNLATAHSQQESWKEAVEAYEKALELQPDMRRSYYGLAACRRALGDKEGGDAAWKKFEEIRDAEDAAAAAAEVTQGNEESQVLFAAETWLDAADVFMEEAMFAGGEGGQGTARRRFQREARDAILMAIEVDPDDPEAYRRLVSYQLSLGDLVQAERAAERWMAKFDTSAAVAHTCAQLFLDYGQRAPAQRAKIEPRALEYLDRALKIDVNLVPANFQWSSIVLTSFGDREDLVRKTLERASLAVKNNPHPRAYDILAWSCHRNGRVQQARTVLEKGMQEFPEDQMLRQRYSTLNARTKQ